MNRFARLLFALLAIVVFSMISGYEISGDARILAIAIIIGGAVAYSGKD